MHISHYLDPVAQGYHVPWQHMLPIALFHVVQSAQPLVGIDRRMTSPPHLRPSAEAMLMPSGLTTSCLNDDTDH